MKNRNYVLFALPAMVLVAVVSIVPLISLLYISLTEDGSFTLANYVRTLSRVSNLKVIFDTFFMSGLVTLFAALAGYIVAYYIYKARPALQALLFALVLLPFWTSALVRTYSWVVLLQRQGIVNDVLQFLGLTSQPIGLVFNFTGAIIGMVHVTLPLFVLPLFSAMKSIDTNCMRAARSLGANDTQVFWGIFFPLTIPAMMAGALMVFVFSLGFYATPQILGGGNVVNIAMKIQQSVTTYPDWPTAACMGIVLLVLTGMFLAVSSLAKRSQLFFKRTRLPAHV